MNQIIFMLNLENVMILMVVNENDPKEKHKQSYYSNK